MDVVYFLIRYTPFWAIPIIFIAGEYGFRYWLKRRKAAYQFFFGAVFLSTLLVIYYVWAGGPEKSVEFLMYLLSG